MRKKLRPLHVRHGQKQSVAEHGVGRDHVRQLVNRTGRVDVSGLQRPHKGRERKHRAEVVHGRIALVGRHGVVAMAFLDVAQTPGHFIESRLPGDPLPVAATGTTDRMPQPVGIGVQVL